jgi:hypothetical protein
MKRRKPKFIYIEARRFGKYIAVGITDRDGAGKLHKYRLITQPRVGVRSRDH